MHVKNHPQSICGFKKQTLAGFFYFLIYVAIFDQWFPTQFSTHTKIIFIYFPQKLNLKILVCKTLGPTFTRKCDIYHFQGLELNENINKRCLRLVEIADFHDGLATFVLKGNEPQSRL